tara:strand:- start:67 stop:924 length:858 start_codon:yes stop_codon:yes gene_type:complete
MITVNSLSGGKTSSYIAANYPADYDVFSLVRIEDCKFPDEKIRKEVEDRIQAPFIGTAEDDKIIYTMLDLEQYIGRPITWVTGRTFDSIIKRNTSKESAQIYLPNKVQRFCTIEMKIEPMFYWWAENIGEPTETRIGFRANETRRAKNMMDRVNSDGLSEFKATFGFHPNGNKKWENIAYQKPVFPLIEDGIYKDKIEKYWNGKSVRFAWMNNCVGCFHKNPVLLKKMFDKHPHKLEWFAKQERNCTNGAHWRTGMKYDDIKSHKSQIELFDDDFNECDSGYCGL